MDFVIGLAIPTNLKNESYHSIFVIVNCLTKMFYYISIKVAIDISGLVKVIINIILH